MFSFTVSISCVLMHNTIASYIADTHFFQYEIMATARSCGNYSLYFRMHKHRPELCGLVLSINFKSLDLLNTRLSLED